MKSRNLLNLAGMCVFCSVFLAVGVEAQQARTGGRTSLSRVSIGTDYNGPLTEILKIRRLEGLGRTTLLRTPEYRSSMPGGTKPARDWVEIRAVYDTVPEWIDEVVFQYYVLTKSPKTDEKQQYSFYQASVRYGDVEGGRNHMSTMYIPPSAMKRYGCPVAIAVEVTVNGKVVDLKSEMDPSVRMPDDWWKNPSVSGDKSVATRTGYLLNRKESPFHFVNIDDYEVIR